MHKVMEAEKLYGAQNYNPLPVVLVKGEGVHVWDDNGKQYIDMMSAYSAVSYGHSNPKLVDALAKQAGTLAVVSRAFYSDKLAAFLEYACKLVGQDKALAMNSGAEAVETAVKAARKWAYTVKGVPSDQAEIIVCEGNFHGRTTTIVSFSSEEQYKAGFGPLTPGFKMIPYGDIDALEKAITPNTAAFLMEPIQGESGIHTPPEGYLKQCAEICKQNDVLLLCDEIQTGLGRTGKILACDHEGVKPDGLMLGKALGGGLLPVSLFLSKAEVMNVFTPGDHGSTFGGSPLAASVGLAALQLLVDESLDVHARDMGEYFMDQLRALNSPLITDIRGKGLFIGLEIDPKQASARDVSLQLLEDGLLTKDTHYTVIRLCPPLTITKAQIDEAINIIKHSLKKIEKTLAA
ncbi:MAG: rocD [Gammaproteobacteria bacterium]|nr:rocD [Gammaproteobacteria bacterium]